MNPIPGSIVVQFGGESIQLLPDRAVCWPRKQTLILADMHLGKDAAFRKAGLPVPAGATARDLARLDALLAATAARRIVVLGDLIHARSSHHPELARAVSTWRAAHADVAILLIRGNHDRSAGRLAREWNIDESEEPFDDGGFIFSHVPRDDAAAPTLAGHIHPVITLRDFDRSAVRAPCFILDRNCAVLPAFGSFTGGQEVKRRDGRQIVIASPGRVVRLC